VAWEQFVTSSSSKWLLVLEDDALFTKTGSGGLWDILQEADKWDNDVLSFILTSEGLDLGALRLTDEDFVAVSSHLHATRFPFTNTAAAYLVNRSMATYFVQTLREKPGLAWNTIDFLINNMMLRVFLKAGTSKISCHHSTEPPFQNASINGGYSSLISS
jgi:GR25 family glycosyltransferase involved in LPS biosynthesis